MLLYYELRFPLKKNPKNLDPSQKAAPDVWDCFERENLPSYNQRNMIHESEIKPVIDVLKQYAKLVCAFTPVVNITVCC